MFQIEARRRPQATRTTVIVGPDAGWRSPFQPEAGTRYPFQSEAGNRYPLQPEA